MHNIWSLVSTEGDYACLNVMWVAKHHSVTLLFGAWILKKQQWPPDFLYQPKHGNMALSVSKKGFLMAFMKFDCRYYAYTYSIDKND